MGDKVNWLYLFEWRHRKNTPSAVSIPCVVADNRNYEMLQAHSYAVPVGDITERTVMILSDRSQERLFPDVDCCRAMAIVSLDPPTR